jgi:hypothetical protein
MPVFRAERTKNSDIILEKRYSAKARGWLGSLSRIQDRSPQPDILDLKSPNREAISSRISSSAPGSCRVAVVSPLLSCIQGGLATPPLCTPAPPTFSIPKWGNRAVCTLFSLSLAMLGLFLPVPTTATLRGQSRAT